MNSCDFLKFITSAKGGHFDYSTRAAKNLLTVLDEGKLWSSLGSFLRSRVMSLSKVLLGILLSGTWNRVFLVGDETEFCTHTEENVQL
jgi:hypothetical protein